MEARRLRAALLFQHENLIGKTHAFDGSILFLPKKLENKVMEVLSQTRQGETVKITITLTNELPSTSPTCLQFYNIIFRRLLKIMNLQQIGRNYYNPSDPISIPKHRLMIWPGFTTSILQYETSIMLCTDVSHKVLRSETVLDFMYTLYDQVGEQQFRELCTKELIGVIVLTRYNNKTYRVDDIDWESSPKNSFKKSDGTEISFVDYYKMFDYNPHLADWSRETRGAPLTSVKPLENWLLIYTRRNYDAANILVQTLFKVTPAMGIRMNKAIIWYSRCVLQDRGQEIVDGLKVCLQAALRTWYSYNEHMPTRIIVYRDGVGDGQLKTLVSYEIPQFLECLKTVGSDYRPKLTVIVVKKRVNSRFFAEIEGKLQNPPPGTVIDLEVTRPEWYDFFIVSQSVKSGTVAPTHYNVIYDSSALKPDYMQRLTYKLCHMYYNWPGVIRVPAPCQYAHKLAFLVGQSIHREPNLTLSEKLYYL
ncbi:Piwi-like protein 1, partial [Ophiophagus hannah]